ncbi:MAG: FMN-binding protein [Spirochaetaceae bacterium]|nr:FMN-binding protein [Spirochaetaceae bacterium]
MRNYFWFFSLLGLLLITACVSFDDIHAVLPDLSRKADGVYRGSYKVGPVEAMVDVAIHDMVITGITIVKHNSSPIGKPAEAITQRIIEKQSLGVDAVSGATASSKAILKAVEEALK